MKCCKTTLIFDSEERQKEKKSVLESESIEISRTLPMDTGCARGSAPRPRPLEHLEESPTEVGFNEILISINPAWHSLDITIMFLSAGVSLLQPLSTSRALRF